jgi:DNA polymerase-3 subunit epsilon
MRQIVLDTETTGLSWERGNRVVEIGCVEFAERRPTGRTFHCYLNPDREFEAGAQEVTGLTLEFLADKPRFREVADEFLAFIDGAELIIHNAAFDVGFLDNELRLLGPQYGCLADRCAIEDSLAIARQRFPGQRNSLDALCKRLGVDNAHRQLHGALLDAQLLAEVYIGLTSGQGEIGFGDDSKAGAAEAACAFKAAPVPARPRVLVSAEERGAHEARLEKLRRKAGSVVWDAWSEPDAAEQEDEPASLATA